MVKPDGNGGVQFDKAKFINLLLSIGVFIIIAVSTFYLTVGGMQTTQAVMSEKQKTIEHRLDKIDIAIGQMTTIQRKLDSLIIVLQ